MSDAHENPAERLAAEYSGRAVPYANWWEPVLHPYGLALLRELPLRGASRVLEIGSGTGGLLADLAHAAPAAVVHGSDRSEGMLRVARERATGVPLAVMDAQRLAYRSASFDAAIMAFVLFHVPDPIAALQEVRRVTRAGGALGVATWGRDPDPPGVAIWTEELDACGAAPDPRDPSVMQQSRMNTPEKLAELLLEAGFAPRKLWNHPFEKRWLATELFRLQVNCGLASRRLPSLSAAVQADCRARVEARLSGLAPSDLVHRAEIVLAVAERPEGRAP